MAVLERIPSVPMAKAGRIVLGSRMLDRLDEVDRKARIV